MPRTRTRIDTVYTFLELSPKAQAVAIDRRRDIVSEFFAEDLTDDFLTTAARLLGIEIATRPIKTIGGATRQEPAIYWELHVQGAGASFNGTYTAPAWPENIHRVRAEFPTDTELHKIAADFDAIGGGISAKVKAGTRSVHKYAATIDVYDDETGDDITHTDRGIAVRDAIRAFMEWMYRSIDNEFTYQTSDETIREFLADGDEEYTEDGKVA